MLPVRPPGPAPVLDEDQAVRIIAMSGCDAPNGLELLFVGENAGPPGIDSGPAETSAQCALRRPT